MLLCILVEIIIDPDTGKQMLILKKEVSKTRKIFIDSFMTRNG
jgi:hypothetical protein